MEAGQIVAQPVSSVINTVKLKLPVFVGVPLMTPVVAFSDSPGGSAPDVTVNV